MKRRPFNCGTVGMTLKDSAQAQLKASQQRIDLIVQTCLGIKTKLRDLENSIASETRMILIII